MLWPSNLAPRIWRRLSMESWSFAFVINLCSSLTFLGWWWWSSGQHTCLIPDISSLNPGEIYIFIKNCCWKRRKINKKRRGLAHFWKNIHYLNKITESKYIWDHKMPLNRIWIVGKPSSLIDTDWTIIAHVLPHGIWTEIFSCKCFAAFTFKASGFWWNSCWVPSN